MSKPKKNALVAVEAHTIYAWDDLPLQSQLFHILDRDGIDNVDEPMHVSLLRMASLIVMVVMVSICIGSIIISSLPQYQPTIPSGFHTVNVVCVVYFTVEYVLRLITAPSIVHFFFQILNLQDLLSILPFYLYLGGVIGEGISNWILITRCVRLIRAMLYFHDFDIVISTLSQSMAVIALMLLVLLVGFPLGGSVIFYAERGSWNTEYGAWYRPCYVPQTCTTEKSPFQNAADGMWYFIETVTTLGYGDYTPTSPFGQFLGSLMMCVGVMMLAYPIMILGVKFQEQRRKQEHLRDIGRIANGERLRALQLQLTNALATAEDEAFLQPLPIYFYPIEINQPRELVVVSREEVRYEPLFFIQRNRDGSLFMNQAVKTSLEVTLRLVLDSMAATKLALSTIAHFSGEGGSALNIVRARFFPVVRLVFSLEKPRDSGSDFIERLRLVHHVIDEIDVDLVRCPVALELNGFAAPLDDQRKIDFHQALHRCRLHCTALVAYSDPVFFDAPIYLGLLGATALMRELHATTRAIVYATQTHVEELLRGVHHLIDLNQQVPTIIMNAGDIRKTIAKAIILRASSVCENPKSLKGEAFLYGRYIDTDEEYHGIFVNRLQKRVSNSKTDHSEHVLCTVKILAVQPTPHRMTFLL